jgi:predicted chitinase
MTYKQQWRKMLKLKKHGFENKGLYFEKKYKKFDMNLQPLETGLSVAIWTEESSYSVIMPYINYDYSVLSLRNVWERAKQEYKQLSI